MGNLRKVSRQTQIIFTTIKIQTSVCQSALLLQEAIKLLQAKIRGKRAIHFRTINSVQIYTGKRSDFQNPGSSGPPTERKLCTRESDIFIT